jgi:hypothetical protein
MSGTKLVQHSGDVNTRVNLSSDCSVVRLQSSDPAYGESLPSPRCTEPGRRESPIEIAINLAPNVASGAVVQRATVSRRLDGTIST